MGKQSLKVQEVQNAGEDMVREFEAKSEEKLSKKMETYEENRQNQLKGMLAKLKEHVSCGAVLPPFANVCFVTININFIAAF